MDIAMIFLSIQEFKVKAAFGPNVLHGEVAH